MGNTEKSKSREGVFLKKTIFFTASLTSFAFVGVRWGYGRGGGGEVGKGLVDWGRTNVVDWLSCVAPDWRRGQ